MTTNIPWGDGSGDYIHLTYSASEGDQIIQVTSDANGGNTARTKTVTFSASGVSSVSLTVMQEAYAAEIIIITRDNTFFTYDDVAPGYPWAVPEGFRRLTGIHFDGNVWYDTGIHLLGSDTIQFSFSASKACNVLGCYTSASADNNYSLYASTTSSAKYLRYNGGTYNSYIAANTRYDVVITPTGSDGMRVDSSWTAKTFTTPSTLMIGTTSTGATSAKLTGDMYGDIVVYHRAYFMALERISDGEIGYYNVLSGEFITNLGTGTPQALGYV